jgi:hypothetical protein
MTNLPKICTSASTRAPAVIAPREICEPPYAGGIRHTPTIPISCYALAACAACEIYKETPADLFDHTFYSRGRVVAIMALWRIFPDEAVEDIACNMGLPRKKKAVMRAIYHTQWAKWFREEDRAAVSIALIRFAHHPAPPRWLTRPVSNPPQAVETVAEPARFIPRKSMPTSKLATVKRTRRVSVTGAFLGDPGFETRRQDRSLGIM